MTAAVFDFNAIAKASVKNSNAILSAAAPHFEITEGPGSNLHSPRRYKRRVVPFAVDGATLEYPAFLYYEPATDEPLWVECDDSVVLRLAHITNAVGQRLANTIPPLLSLTWHAGSWARALYSAIERRGIECVYTAPQADGARIGHQIFVNGEYWPLHQMHVDWCGQIADVDEPIADLADAIAKKLAPRTRLYSCRLQCPPASCAESALLEGGPADNTSALTARAVRVIMCWRDDDHDIVEVVPTTRIDVLFPVIP